MVSISPLKASAFIILSIFSFNAQAEYYYVETASIEDSSPKCISKTCHVHCYKHCHKHRHKVKYYKPKFVRHKVVRRYYRPVMVRQAVVVPMTAPCGYGGEGCTPCGDYSNYTRYACVENQCANDLWVPGYMCDGRWVPGHWRY